MPSAASTRSTVFPVHAGMFRSRRIEDLWLKCFPRTRGDVPVASGGLLEVHSFSPYTRGCSVQRSFLNWDMKVFPVHAGMFRVSLLASVGVVGFPRTRGDVPHSSKNRATNTLFSPYTRGCSVGTGVVSPCLHVFPVHAGMFRTINPRGGRDVRFPRTRGDVPYHYCYC